jgi:hypothetical protein
MVLVGKDAATVIAEIDELLARAGLRAGQNPARGDYGVVPGATATDLTALSTAYCAAIERLTAPGNKYREVARGIVTKTGWASSQTHRQLVGVLNALRTDYEHGYVRSIEELVHADLFADFLEMAQELLDKKFKDPAAVLTGSVLEEHLRKMCDAHAVPVINASSGRPRKADVLNSDLVKAGAYYTLEQKQVTAWLDLRNKAAHGKYDEYDAQQVALMLEGVRSFLVRHPA